MWKLGEFAARWYTASMAGSENQALTKAPMSRLRERGAIESVYKLATAFANPGRIEVFQRLQTKPMTLAELGDSGTWSRRTLRRHLAKLESRGFVRQDPEVETFAGTMPSDPLGRILGKAAAERM